MTAIDNLVHVDFIEQLVDQGYTHRSIADILRISFPGVRGLSERSVRRFCEQHGIQYSQRLSDADLKHAVASVVRQVSTQFTYFREKEGTSCSLY